MGAMRCGPVDRSIDHRRSHLWIRFGSFTVVQQHQSSHRYTDQGSCTGRAYCAVRLDRSIHKQHDSGLDLGLGLGLGAWSSDGSIQAAAPFLGGLFLQIWGDDRTPCPGYRSIDTHHGRLIGACALRRTRTMVLQPFRLRLRRARPRRQQLGRRRFRLDPSSSSLSNHGSRLQPEPAINSASQSRRGRLLPPLRQQTKRSMGWGRLGRNRNGLIAHARPMSTTKTARGSQQSGQGQRRKQASKQPTRRPDDDPLSSPFLPITHLLAPSFGPHNADEQQEGADGGDGRLAGAAARPRGAGARQHPRSVPSQVACVHVWEVID